MQKLSSKIVAIVISLLMIFSIGGAFPALLQNAHAATVNVTTEAFINVAPNPCGVGQAATIDFFLGVPLVNSGYPVGMTIYVGLPDGTNTTLGPFIGDETGGTHTTYTPETPGTYTFYWTYGGQTYTVGANTFYEEPCTSPTATLTVTSTPAAQYPFTPLPTTYWQTPVNAQNVQNWYSITGPWLGLAANAFATTGSYNSTSNYNPYTLAPTTGHILWTTPWAEGGVAGGDAGPSESSDYWITSQYEPKWAPVVINGMMWSTWYTGTTSESNGIRCLNLYNGQTEYIINTTNPLICGMVMFYETINEYGYVGPYIWTTGTLPASQTGGTAYNERGTEWNMYDGLTGNYISSIVNGTSSGLTTDANGNLLMYYNNATAGTQIIYPNELAASAEAVTTTGPTLTMFNFTQALQSDMQNLVTSGFADWLWEPPQYHQYLFNLGIELEVPVPASVLAAGAAGGSIAGNTFVMSVNNGITESGTWEYLAGFSLTNFAPLWTSNITETPYCRINTNSGFGYRVEVNLDTDVAMGISLATGQLAWTNTLLGDNGKAASPYDTYDIFSVLAPGVAYIYGFGGDMWALNINNGDLIWYTNTTTLFGSPGLETPYGTWPLWIFNNVEATNTEVFYAEGHEYDPPLFHDAQEFALNATTGQLVWSVLSFDTTGGEISYGILLGLNSYDGQIYAYGQGPSATTVTAPNPVGTVGSPMVITGTVLDVSAGTTQEVVKADFPYGVPCVSDASMGQWMAYVYEQQSEPTNVIGVPVTLTAIDPNGNFVTLGTTTSNSLGDYGITWTPPDVPGNYTITATFAGSGGYYGSSAGTFVYVGSAATPAPPTATPVSLATTQSMITYGVIAIIVVIIIIGAVLAILMLRKKP